jgi:hypothetical protein
MSIALDDGEGLWVFVVLHNEPASVSLITNLLKG